MPIKRNRAPNHARCASAGGGPASLSAISPRDQMKNARNITNAEKFPGRRMSESRSFMMI